MLFSLSLHQDWKTEPGKPWAYERETRIQMRREFSQTLNTISMQFYSSFENVTE